MVQIGCTLCYPKPIFVFVLVEFEKLENYGITIDFITWIYYFMIKYLTRIYQKFTKAIRDTIQVIFGL